MTDDRLVSLSEAARRLSDAGDQVDRSTLSRYVRQHADDLRPAQRGRETVVDVELLVEHRRANALVTDGKGFSADKAFGVERTAKTRAQRLGLEMSLAEREGLLTVVREVENAAHAAVGVMRSALSNAAGDTAEAIAKATGLEAQVVRPHIRGFERLALAAFVKGLTENAVIAREGLDRAVDADQSLGGGEG